MVNEPSRGGRTVVPTSVDPEMEGKRMMERRAVANIVGGENDGKIKEAKQMTKGI